MRIDVGWRPLELAASAKLTREGRERGSSSAARHHLTAAGMRESTYQPLILGKH